MSRADTDEASLHRASAKQEWRGATLEPESQRTTRRADPFANLAELRPAYKTFVEDSETLAEGSPERAAREISLGNDPHDGVEICNRRCKRYGK